VGRDAQIKFQSPVDLTGLFVCPFRPWEKGRQQRSGGHSIQELYPGLGFDLPLKQNDRRSDTLRGQSRAALPPFFFTEILQPCHGYRRAKNFPYPDHIWNFPRSSDNCRSWQVIDYFKFLSRN
jgi:hypothetical protein